MRAALSATFAVALLTGISYYGSARAQADVAGHWEGLVTSQIGGVQNVALDIGRNADRSLKGALTTNDVSGLPLASVSQSGDAVRFALAPALNTSFEGHLDAGGKVITGIFSTPAGEAGVSFTRDGEAEFATAPVNPRIDPRLEGAWEGAIEAGGRRLRARLTLANGATGATGMLTSVDEGLDIPVAIKADGGKLSLSMPMVDGVFEGALNAAGDALAGTYTQHGQTFPLVLARAKP